MGLFSNPFLSISGQVERLKNVVSTVGAAAQNVASTLTLGLVKSSPIQANVSNQTAKKVLETVANKPAQTALAGAVIANPVGAFAAGKAISSTVVSGAKNIFNTLSPLQKAATVIATPVAIGVVASSSKVRSDLIKAPSSLVNLGSNIGKTIDNPSFENVKTTFKENPVAAGVLVGAAALTTGALTAGIISNVANTQAVKKNTAATINSQYQQLTPSVIAAAPAPVALIPAFTSQTSSTTPVTSTTAVTPPTVSPTSIKKATKKKKKKVTKKKKAKKKTTKKKTKKKAKTIKRKKKTKKKTAKKKKR
jgi:hypothetical protein